MSNAFPGVKDSTSVPLPAQTSPQDPKAFAATGSAAKPKTSEVLSRPQALAGRRSRKCLLAVLSIFLGLGMMNPAANAHLRSTALRSAPKTAVLKAAVLKTAAIKTAVLKTAAIKTTVIKTAARPVKVKSKPALIKATKKPTKKPVTKPAAKPPVKITKPSSTAATVPSTSALSPAPTEAPTTTPQARVLPTPVAAPVNASAAVVQPPATPVSTDTVINPLPVASPTVAPVGAGTAITVPPVTTTTTTSIPPAPFPAPADPPKRAAAATLDPYRGLGAWVDRLDWSNLFSKNKPAVTLAIIDQMAAAGIQTIYIQIPHWQTTPDIYEPERLQPLIDRAHALGMYVVGWYLPFFFDVNTDLRKVVAMANLDLDGIQIDIETSGLASMANVNLRNTRLSEFNRSLRSLLPGRLISADIVAPTWMDGQVDRWSWPNYPAKTRPLFWGGPFPYAEVAATYDLVALQLYWTENSANSGWRDSQTFVQENMTRMRAYSGRPDYPIQAIGGVNTSKSPLNDLIGYMDAAKASGSFGFSLYDWTTTPKEWWPAMWGLRSTVDPRFPPPALSPYVPLAQPATPPVTTTTTTKAPATVPAVAAPSSTIPTVPLIEIVVK